MAKSKILKDITTSKNLESVLKRLYIILNDLESIDMVNWVKKELYGYDDEDQVPEYRSIITNIMGDYDMVGYGKIWSYKHHILPTINLDEETLNNLTHKKLFQPIATIVNMIENYNETKVLSIPLPVSSYFLFQKGTTITISNAYLNIDKSELIKVINKVESKVLDLVVYLEKKFGNLDEFDIDNFDLNKKELASIVDNCKSIIFNNCDIQTFDNSSLKSKNLVNDKSKINNKTNKSNTGNGNYSSEKHTNVNTEINITNNNKASSKSSWWKRLFHRKEKTNE